jgi:non-specific serine/threonine protein kinase
MGSGRRRAPPPPAGFGALLRGHRRAAALTQEAFAERAGLSVRGLQHLEAGDARPSRGTLGGLLRALAALGVPPDSLDGLAAAAGRDRPRALEPAPVGLPPQLTSFVGRERELAAVEAHLRGAGVRLVTLTGPGGVGKTRLAVAAARAAGGAFPDGVVFVPLAALAEPALVPAGAAQALGVRESPARPVAAAVRAALRAARLLLVLDSCEHLADACAGLVDALLGACPSVTVLATSRAPLGLAGEVQWRVPPLALPDAPAAASPVAAAVARHDAVRLFVERAQAVQPAFAVTDRNAAAVAQLCRRLDGLPLALELAAARVRVLTVDELLRRLEDRFRLLTGGRAAPPRHQTLRALVAWSHDLLDEPDRRLFARLGVFAGGFALAAAESVGAGDGLAAADVLEGLTRLVDQSLVQPEPGPDGVGRYHLLETLRVFALERLAERGEAAAARTRHLEYLAAFAERAAPELLAGAQVIERLDGYHDDCRAALRWALAHPCPETTELALRLAGALVQFWRVRAHHREGYGWLERLLALPAAGPPTAARARALIGVGQLARYLPDRAAARPRVEAGLTLARALGHPRLILAGLHALAGLARGEGDDAAAVGLQAETLKVARRLGDPAAVATARFLLGWMALGRGDYAAARRHLEASLDLHRRAGLGPAQVASVLNRLGDVQRVAGDLLAARALHAEALAAWRALGYPRGIADALGGLGEVAVALGDTAAARACYDEACALAGQPSGEQFPEWGARALALMACALGEAGAARAHAQRAVALWRDPARRGRHSYRIAALLEDFAALAAARAQPARALRLVGAADALRAGTGNRRYPLRQAYLDRHLAPARRALGGGAAAALAAGHALTLDQAISEAVDWAPELGAGWPAAEPHPEGLRAAGQLRVDGRLYQVWRGEERLAPALSPLEFALVAYLYAHRERVCTRRELGDALWGAHAWDPPMLHNLVRRVKRKLEPAPGGPRYIHSRRGIGYRLTA